MEEKWLPIPSLQEWYVSNKGRLMYSKLFSQPQFYDVNDYTNGESFTIASIVDEVITTIHVQYLVLSLFKGNPNMCTKVIFKDGNRRNLCVDNLEWVEPYKSYEYEETYENVSKKILVKKGLLTIEEYLFAKDELKWATCKDFSNYKISTFGEVTDLEGNVIQPLPMYHNRFHQQIVLDNKQVAIDYLVMNTFSHLIGRNLKVCHKDANILNNHISNLYAVPINIKGQPVKCLELGLVFPSIQSVEKYTNFNLDNVSDSAFYGISVHGLTWVYTNEKSNIDELTRKYFELEKQVEIITDVEIPTLEGEIWKDSIAYQGIVKISNMKRVYCYPQKRWTGRIVAGITKNPTLNEKTGELFSYVNYKGKTHKINVTSEYRMLFGKTSLLHSAQNQKVLAGVC